MDEDGLSVNHGYPSDDAPSDGDYEPLETDDGNGLGPSQGPEDGIDDDADDVW